MITKESFVKIVNACDAYFNGEAFDALKILGMDENLINNYFDAIIDAVDNDIDPKHVARNDDFTYDCGSYVCEWLFGTGEFQEKCKTAEELYDYIIEQYESEKTLVE